jgi:murein DD-endopeptidase MepM/ murein hydrolase activator NlpD
MWSFLSDLARNPGTTYTVVLMEREGVDQARQYELQPKNLAVTWGATLLLVFVLAASLTAFTPVRQFIPGYGTEELRQNARMNLLRVQALQDSLAVQRRYVDRLQQLMTGRVDSVAQQDAPAEPAERSEGEAAGEVPSPREPSSGDWEDHRQPAVSVSSFPASGAARPSGSSSGLASLPLPLTSPVETGFPTRGFDARSGHYAIDIAVSEGEFVRTVGEGYVVLADWTQDGGYTIAVQHADGYLSIYKHNKRLLKNVGDHVRAQESIAVTGNTGEITTGPHLHFELWHDGLAQDPRPYVAGW